MYLEWIVIIAIFFAFGSGIRMSPRISWGLPRWKIVYAVGIDVFLYIKKLQEDRARRWGSNELYLDRLTGTDYSSSLAKAGWGGKAALFFIELTGSESLPDEIKIARVFYLYMFSVSLTSLVAAYLVGVPSIIQSYV